MLRIPNRIAPADVDEPIVLFRTFARNPAMWGAMSTWGRYELGRELSIDQRTREVAILRTCARCRCPYEWGVHVAYFAERVGLTDAEVAATWAAAADSPSQPDGLVVRLADALHDTAAVDDDLWAELAARFDDAQLLDLLFLCGWYHAIAYAANGAGVAPEPWAAVPPALDADLT